MQGHFIMIQGKGHYLLKKILYPPKIFTARRPRGPRPQIRDRKAAMFFWKQLEH
jgi:hypothetical protein